MLIQRTHYFSPRQVQMNKPEPAYLETDVITLGSHETEGREGGE